MRVGMMVVLCAVSSVAMADEPVEALPNPATLIQTGRCESPVAGASPSVIGADQTYSGTLSATSSGRITGIEQRHLTPNTTWRTTTAPDGTRGQDCMVTWKVEGQIGRPQSCRDCDISITFEANIDPLRSTCNQ